jgi:hypothetical protein
MTIRSELVLVAVMASASLAHADADCDLSDRAAGRLVAQLGVMPAIHDAGNDSDYSFAVCETWDVFEQTGRVDIVGSLTGTTLSRTEAEKLAVEVADSGQECVNRGAPYSPSAGDNRLVEYHFCQKNAKPSRLEIVMRPVDKNGAARPAQTLKVAWPDLHAAPPHPQPFVQQYPDDKPIDCDDGQTVLGQLMAVDDANQATYRFVACQSPKGVSVFSNFLTGTEWSAAAVAAAGRTDSCTPSGAPYGNQGPGDERSITYQLCGKHGAAYVQIDAVTLDANWKKHPVKSLTAPVH